MKTIWEVSQINNSAFTNLKGYIVGPVLEEAYSRQGSFSQPGKFVGFLLPVKLLLLKKTDTFFYRSTRHLLDT